MWRGEPFAAFLQRAIATPTKSADGDRAPAGSTSTAQLTLSNGTAVSLPERSVATMWPRARSSAEKSERAA